MVSEADASTTTGDDDWNRSDERWYLVGTSTLVLFHVFLSLIAFGVGLGALSPVLTGSASPGTAAGCLLGLAVGSFSAYRAAVLILE